jgi:hypothetical protein
MCKTIIGAITFSLILSSCSSVTSLVRIQDRDFGDKPLERILVVGVSQDLQIRRFWEDMIWLQLFGYDVDVYRGMQVIPPLKDYTNEEIYQILKQRSIGAVLTFAVTDFWIEYYNTPEYTISKTTYSSSSVSKTDFNGYLFNPIFTTNTNAPGSATTVTTKHGDFGLSWENTQLDIRLLRFNADNTIDIIWRVHSTTKGDIFTKSGQVVADGVARICSKLSTDGFLKVGSSGITGKTFRNIGDLGILMVWGGMDYNHKLGYFNFKSNAYSLITNPWGKYGKLKKDGIWNPKSIYASDTSNCSACNPNATYPPVVKNKQGKIIGYLTINTHKLNAITDPDILEWLETEICGQKEK